MKLAIAKGWPVVYLISGATMWESQVGRLIFRIVKPAYWTRGEWWRVFRFGWDSEDA